MPADKTVRVEYVVRCQRIGEAMCEDRACARNWASQHQAISGTTCGPHRVIKRTITEEDVTDAE